MSSATPRSVDAFVQSLTRPWPDPSSETAFAISSPGVERVSSYDNALLALYWLRHGERARAASILAALAQLQAADGSLPFSFSLPRPEPGTRYVRSGAAAWVGYAATEYLNADREGPAREQIAQLAHRTANYLLQHQLTRSADRRNGLVLGGEGTYRLAADSGKLEEIFVPGEVPWASIEHNIDSYFFLRDFGALTGDARFGSAAQRIAASLREHTWLEASGQLAQGVSESELDTTFALDCASWGALFLVAIGDTARAETAVASADFRYAAHDPKYGASGHRPYAHAPIAPNRGVMAHNAVAVSNWDQLDAVWAEGSAGVALAALRLGHRARAQQILEQLEKLRDPSGGVPNFTLQIPFEFDGLPSLAGTLWIELVRDELMREDAREMFWRSR